MLCSEFNRAVKLVLLKEDQDMKVLVAVDKNPETPIQPENSHAI